MYVVTKWQSVYWIKPLFTRFLLIQVELSYFNINLKCIHLKARLKINIFGLPDIMSCTNQFVPDIKDIVTDLYWIMT